MDDARVALVTGGSRGLGRAIVEKLAADGYRVLFTFAASASGAAGVEAAVRVAGGQARSVKADVAERGSAAAVVQEALRAFGRIDVLVNNAGTHLPGVTIADTSFEEFDRVLRVNLYGTFNMVQAVLPHMRGRGGGNIVNLSSNITSRMPAQNCAYTVSKVGVEAITRILSKEEGRNGIRVNAVAPGPIRTDMLEETMVKIGPERAEAFIRSVPMGRKGEPREIADAVAWLVSDAASYVTGQVVFVNGGGPGN
ncbi:MAG TPA: 3-oxoacyl-ACP reductase family protein [Burkholderiales bacterium]|nr:3-oxoacyl-ACP reductase family protein [Burkholderiales bacterium]